MSMTSKSQKLKDILHQWKPTNNGIILMMVH